MSGLAPDADLVFLHPIGLDRRFWAGVAPDEARVLEFPGHGDVPAADRVTLAGLVEYVVDGLPRPSTLVGLSLGGMVALEVAANRPDVVSSLVIACAGPASHPDVMRERAEATREGGMEGVLGSTLERWFTPEALAAAGHAGVAYARRRLLDDDPETFARYWEAMAAHDVKDALGSIDVPVTVIAGAQDRASSVETLTQMATSMPNAVLEVLEGPHMLPLEQPSTFSAALARHQERMRTRGER